MTLTSLIAESAASSDHELGLVALSVSLLGTLIVSTWRFSSLASKLLSAVQRLEEKEREQDGKLARLDKIPVMESEMEHVKKNYSLIPKMEAAIKVLEAKALFSREMRAQRGSRPHFDDEEDGGGEQ